MPWQGRAFTPPFGLTARRGHLFHVGKVSRLPGQATLWPALGDVTWPDISNRAGGDGLGSLALPIQFSRVLSTVHEHRQAARFDTRLLD